MPKLMSQTSHENIFGSLVIEAFAAVDSPIKSGQNIIRVCPISDGSVI